MVDASSSVGVVAIGRNEGERLRRCLASIPPGLAVVYVDSGSTDGSPDVARAAGAQVIALDMARPFTAARARNEGWQALLAAAPTLEYVQFVDGDCEFEPGWIGQATVFLDAHPQVAVACGRRRERFPEASLFNRLCDAEWDTSIGEAAACGGDALVRCAALANVGGYDGALMAGEEPEFCLRLRKAGWLIFRLDTPMTIHDAAMLRLRQWWLRARRGGFGYAQVWDVTRRLGEPLYGRELARAVFWAGAVPLVTLLLSMAIDWRFVLLAPLAWCAQIARLARREGIMNAFLLVLEKFAECGGALDYARLRFGGAAGHAITYK